MKNPASDFKSVILRSTHIAILRILQAEPQEWGTYSNSINQRTVQLNVEWIETLKGTVKPDAPKQFNLSIFQYKNAGPFILPVPGVWSHIDLLPESEIVAFCRTNRILPQEILREDSCELIRPADAVLAEARLAMNAINQMIELHALLQEARIRPASLDEIFCEFLWENYEDVILGNSQDYDEYLSFLQEPDLPPIARSVALDSVYSAVSAIDDGPTEQVFKLAIVMFRLIDLPQANILHDNLIQVFLPNLLGLEGGAQKRTADEVFKQSLADRASARRALLKYKGTADPSRLLHWLE